MTKKELHDVLTYKDMMKTAENMTNWCIISWRGKSNAHQSVLILLLSYNLKFSNAKTQILVRVCLTLIKFCCFFW
jgi:hypothetical protein